MILITVSDTTVIEMATGCTQPCLVGGVEVVDHPENFEVEKHL